jgi:hypothetical protein
MEMPMADYDPKVLEVLTLDALLGVWAAADEQVHEAEVYRHAVEQTIAGRMYANRQESAETDETAATFTGKPVWDRERLSLLREYLDADEWDAILTVPRPPPERYPDARKATALAKAVGDPVREIVESARRVEEPRLSIRRKPHTEKEVAV